MTILKAAKYLIKHQGMDGKEELFIDSFDTLRRTIATTWGLIPHRVEIKDKVVKVIRTDTIVGETLDSTFTFVDITSQPLPTHL